MFSEKSFSIGKVVIHAEHWSRYTDLHCKFFHESNLVPGDVNKVYSHCTIHLCSNKIFVPNVMEQIENITMDKGE